MERGEPESDLMIAWESCTRQSGSLLLPRIGRGRGLRVKVKVEASRRAIVPTVGVDPSDERARLKCLLGPETSASSDSEPWEDLGSTRRLLIT